MNNTNVSFEEKLSEYQLAYELLRRKLRTSYVSQIIKHITPDELKEIYRMIHQGASPRAGSTPSINTIPYFRESFIYLSLFASLYRNASLIDIKTEIDVSAVLFAWDFFCETFPNHIRESKPYDKIRPANFNEAWIIAQSLKNGLTTIKYCNGCIGDTLIMLNSSFQPICQICDIDRKRENSRRKSSERTNQLS